MVEKRTVYKLQIDGVTYYEEYTTVEKAMEGARVHFAKDHGLKKADIIKYTTDMVGVTMLNKDYEEAAV